MRKLLAIMFTDIAGYTARMGADEPSALRLLERARTVVTDCVGAHAGRVLEHVGDGTLATFESAVAAVACARDIQRALVHDADLRLRIGVHIGDVLLEDGDVFGDGVNVASRIHGLAPPGGICISERVYEVARNQPGLNAVRLGPRTLKNVSEPVVVYEVTAAPGAVKRRWVRRAAVVAAAILACATLLAFRPVRDELLVSYALRVVPLMQRKFQQRVDFATTSDGVRLAYATAGSGPPLVFVVGWMMHIERGFDSPAYESHISRLTEQHQVIRYDGRGTGLSDRDVSDLSLEARVRDLEAVVEAVGLERFDLLGISLGGPTSVVYAARHPERVSRLVLMATYASAKTIGEHNRAWDSIISLMRTSWDGPSASGRQMFASLISPDAPPVGVRIMSELIAVSTPGDTAARIVEGCLAVDVRPLLAQIRAPTLVLHARRDLLIPLEAGRELAAGIPRARFVVFDSDNHALPPVDAAGRSAYDAIEAFLYEAS